MDVYSEIRLDGKQNVACLGSFIRQTNQAFVYIS